MCMGNSAIQIQLLFFFFFKFYNTQNMYTVSPFIIQSSQTMNAKSCFP